MGRKSKNSENINYYYYIIAQDIKLDLLKAYKIDKCSNNDGYNTLNEQLVIYTAQVIKYLH